jgi:hypothetical protein
MDVGRSEPIAERFAFGAIPEELIEVRSHFVQECPFGLFETYALVDQLRNVL